MVEQQQQQQLFDRCGALYEERVRSEQLDETKRRLLHALSPLLPGDAPVPKIVLVKSLAIKCGQLRLSCAFDPAVAEGQSLVVAPLQSHAWDSVAQFYWLTHAQWLGAKLLVGGCRVLRLDLSPPLSLAPPSPPTFPVEQSEAEPCFSLMEIDRPVEQLHAVTLAYDAVTDEEAVFQLGQLVDYMLRVTLFAVSPASLQQRLEAKWLAHMERADGERCAASAAVIASYVRAKSHCCDTVVRHWIAMECGLLARRFTLAHLEWFHGVLGEHLAVIGVFKTAEWQHSAWHSLVVAEGYWRCEAQGRFAVHALWLLEPELATLGKKRLPRRGVLTLSAEEMTGLLVPCLYRHLLLDCVHAWFASSTAPPMLTTELKALAALTLVGKHCHESLFEYNAGVLQWHTSPVMKHAYRLYGEREAAAVARPHRQWTARTLAGEAVEMEDLFADPGRYLPPCLARLVQPRQWYKHEDRLAMVSCLVDSGYRNGERAVEQMCRGQANNANNRSVIRRLFRDLSLKKAGPELEGRRVSRCCDTIINAVYQEGNRLRCPFEEAANGTARRRDHSSEERDAFRTQCAASLDAKTRWQPRVYSPLDYISHRLSALNEHGEGGDGVGSVD